MEAEKLAGGIQKAQRKVLLATVKGDVHDIGKNIVGVVLGCNNYDVIDLGVMVPCETILRTAREHGVDMIGLSGLITPSLDEMVHVAREMTREGFAIPLLIGGATTSKTHTAVKIAPAYSAGVVHVLDASRSVGVVGQLVRADQRAQFVEKNRLDQEQIRSAREEREPKRLLTLQEARKRRVPIAWAVEDIPAPSFIGVRVLDTLELGQLAPYIDWSPFFHAWELKGRYPKILEDPTIGPRAKELFMDAQALLREIVKDRLLTARGVYGFFPANSVGEDIELYTDASRSAVRMMLHTLRQQMPKAEGQPNFALADFVAPKSTGLPDHIGAFAVTAGIGEEEIAKRFDRVNDDYNKILVKALADRLAEAFAEHMHERVRKEFWGYAPDENLTNEELIAETYQGIRPAPGYPSQPEHTEKRTLFDLLKAEEEAGIVLTESYAMTPGAAVSGLYFSHPESHYFGVGKIARDQVADYAKRKDWTLEEAEKWLAPILIYDPKLSKTEAA